ncbi:aconitase X swivel domain-containing protein [Nocardioides sp. LHG3406-4]|uniref:aconitase X swivel domain-containing protein n=1 Tax=Nocardioides sp. LHG3406-4 TaxID=2804575 RepID=UPI003CF93AEC
MKGVSLQPGSAAGELLVLEEPLSFWGGTDLATGTVVDAHHPQLGLALTGRVVAMAASRGSSSSSSVLAEQIRLGVGPAALLLRSPDAIVSLGAMIAAELYDRETPVVLLEPGDFDRLPGHPGLALVDAGPRDALVALAHPHRAADLDR